MKKVILFFSFYLIALISLSQEHYFKNIIDGTGGTWKQGEGVVRVKNYGAGLYLVSDHDFIRGKALYKWCVKYSKKTPDGKYIYIQDRSINSTTDFEALITDVKLSDMARGKEGTIYINYGLLEIIFKCKNR